MPKKWIDISIPIKTNMVHWPGDPAISVERRISIDRGDVCNVSTIAMGTHTGTHMDSMLHFIAGGKSMDKLPFEATIGPCRVVEIKDPVAIRPEELVAHKLKKWERILFKTRNSKRSYAMPSFDEDFVYVSKEAAVYLAKVGIMTVGIDYLSVGGFKMDGIETHHALLGKGIWIIEGLNLAKVKPGKYELVCLPIKIEGGDGAPARAILR